jgi:hypothetical protein
MIEKSSTIRFISKEDYKFWKMRNHPWRLQDANMTGKLKNTLEK